VRDPPPEPRWTRFSPRAQEYPAAARALLCRLRSVMSWPPRRPERPFHRTHHGYAKSGSNAIRGWESPPWFPIPPGSRGRPAHQFLGLRAGREHGLGQGLASTWSRTGGRCPGRPGSRNNLPSSWKPYMATGERCRIVDTSIRIPEAPVGVLPFGNVAEDGSREDSGPFSSGSWSHFPRGSLDHPGG